MRVRVVLLRVSDLGFPEGALTREIIGSERDQDLFGNPAPFTGGRAQQLGLELCPPDVGPQCRLDYKDQPPNERLYVAMKPISASDGDPRVFVIAHSTEGLSLGAARARPDDRWAPDDRFLFSLGPQPSLDDSLGRKGTE